MATLVPAFPLDSSVRRATRTLGKVSAESAVSAAPEVVITDQTRAVVAGGSEKARADKAAGGEAAGRPVALAVDVAAADSPGLDVTRLRGAPAPVFPPL